MTVRLLSVDVVRPTTDGWEPKDLLRDVLDLTVAAIKAESYGPWVVCFSQAWRPYLKLPYRSGDHWCGVTVRERICRADSFFGVCITDRLPGWSLALAEVVGRWEADTCVP